MLSVRLPQPMEMLRPVITLGDPPHAVAIPLKPQAISIVFYFIKPLGAGGNRLAERR